MSRRFLSLLALMIGVSALGIGLAWTVHAQEASAAIPIDADDIAGTVTSSNGPEAGVWVIAQTHDLGVKTFNKIVVTDSQGKYLLPQLPNATYNIWVRGYGLVDSPQVTAHPGVQLDLHAVLAPNALAAAQYYPANYWYSLLKPPAKSNFPGTGTGPQGNGISTDIHTQEEWIANYKMNCNVCHQVGDKATRVIEPELGEFPSSQAAWAHRTLVGQNGDGMAHSFSAPGREVALKTFADWTDRIAAGALPPAPPRPQGVERNLVVTEWSWGKPNLFLHDIDPSNHADPTVNANGPVYGSDFGNDNLVTVDPQTNIDRMNQVPNIDDPFTTKFATPRSEPFPSPYWGKQLYWDNISTPADSEIDHEGRVWISAGSRTPEDQPAYCSEGPYAALTVYKTDERELTWFDPQTGRFTAVKVCFDNHHVRFAADKDETIYTDSIFDGGVGWLNTHMYEQTGDVAKSEGWCRPWYDLNHDGKIDPKVDRMLAVHVYGVQPAPDGFVWLVATGPYPGYLIRIDPKTCVSEAWQPPLRGTGLSASNGPRGIDIDAHGVIWTGLAGSGQLASFDMRKCKKPYNTNLPDPSTQCPEGWTLHPVPGPNFEGTNVKVDFMYYNYNDQAGTLGLGKDIPMTNGTNSDSLLALLPNDKWAVLRVPYPMGFYSRYMAGRIDDPNTGWKGRGVWATYGANAPWHYEGGLGQYNYAVKFQMRPDPLAK